MSLPRSLHGSRRIYHRGGEREVHFLFCRRRAIASRLAQRPPENPVLGQPTIAVDTHVFRIANRIGLCKTKTPEQTEHALEKNIPDKWKQHSHHWLILHGRYTWVARKPKYPECLIRDLCEFKEKTGE